jgi:hypothetical protein
LEFDELCQDVDEFEPLPDHGTRPLITEPPETDDEDEPTQLDGLILAGLVSPV